MSTLQSLLRPVIAMVNRQIGATTPARELCEKLDGRVMALRVTNTGLAMYLTVTKHQIDLSEGDDVDPDVIVSGSLISLAKLAGPDGDDAIRHGDIELSGDALIAQQFQKLLSFGRPDLEEELSAFVGDAAAYNAGQFVRRVREWSQSTRETMLKNVGEYLQEESDAVPRRDEANNFRGQVDALRDDVARFEARLHKLESKRDNGESL